VTSLATVGVMTTLRRPSLRWYVTFACPLVRPTVRLSGGGTPIGRRHRPSTPAARIDCYAKPVEIHGSGAILPGGWRRLALSHETNSSR